MAQSKNVPLLTTCNRSNTYLISDLVCVNAFHPKDYVTIVNDKRSCLGQTCLIQMFSAEVDEDEDRFENIPVYDHVCKV